MAINSICFLFNLYSNTILTFSCLIIRSLEFGTEPGCGTTGYDDHNGDLPFPDVVEVDLLTQGKVGLQVLSWLTSLVSKVGLSLGDNAEVSSTVFNLSVSFTTDEHSIVMFYPITSPFSLGKTLSLFMTITHTGVLGAAPTHY